MREKRILLKNGIQFPFIGGKSCDILSVKQNLSLVWAFKASQQTQGCSLSASGRTKKGQKFMLPDIQI